MTPASNSVARSSTRPAVLIAAAYAALASMYVLLPQGSPRNLEEDVTTFAVFNTVKEWLFVVLTTLLLYVLVRRSVINARLSEVALHESDARYRRMIETTSEGVWIVDDGGRTDYVNETMASMLGYQPHEMLGRRFSDFVERSDAPPRAPGGGESPPSAGRGHRDVQFRRKDGAVVWTIVASAEIPDRDGRPRGTLKMVTDITARRKAAEALERTMQMQQALMNELDHRVRNNLCAMVSLIDLSRRGSTSVDAFAEQIGGRLRALAHTHTLLSLTGRTSAPMRRLLGDLAPHERRDRVRLIGPDVDVAARQAGPMALVFHELMAHSMARGALSGPGRGDVWVEWRLLRRIDQALEIEIVWIETGGPQSPSAPTGQARQVIEGLVASDLRGSIDWGRPGARRHVRIRAALDDIAAALRHAEPAALAAG
jgi:PAS domain S-box-containing protein